MRVRILPVISASVLLFALSSIPKVAHAAALDSCGGVFLTSASQCEFKRDQECSTTCQTVSVEQSCAAQLYVSCSSSCTATASTECTQTCSPVCVTACTPAESSNDICISDCSSDCDTKCASATNPEQCHASCTHCCDQKCSDTCHSDDQPAACDTKCATACNGTCTATANTDCQITCQSMSFDSCQTTTVQKCQTDCMDTGGAIFCDGQFLNATTLKDCASELSASLSINLDVSVTAKATATIGNSKTTTKCSFAPATTEGNGLLMGAIAGIAIAFGVRRRRS